MSDLPDNLRRAVKRAQIRNLTAEQRAENARRGREESRLRMLRALLKDPKLAAEARRILNGEGR